MNLHLSICGVVALVLSLVGCEKHEPPAPALSASASAAPGSKVLARVNGVPITEADVELRLAGEHETGKSEEHRKNVLEQLIGKELLAQKAREAGLEQDPKYQEGLQRLLAQVSAYQRQELAELYLRREGDKRAGFTEDDQKAYFKANEKRIRTEIHVLQILRRSEAAIVEARSLIDRGKSFEDAAKELFPNLPEGQRPWDLGYLSFQKIPEPWRETIYELKPGEMSGILRGPNERFWLIKVVDVRTNEKLDYESVKEAIVADMKVTKTRSSSTELEKELRASAKIEIVSSP